jgi:NTP-dependent ternary system trypsin peptidase co-occuring protein
MGRLMEVPLESGGAIVVEVDERSAARTMRGGGDAGSLVERGGRTLEQSLGGIVPALREAIDRLREVSSELSEVEVELGLKLTAEAGMVVAKAATEANFRVMVRWQRPAEVDR